MLMHTSEIQKLEAEIKAGDEAIERFERLERLYNNTDFQELILKYFMRDECARYVQQSVDNLQAPENRANALAMAQTSGHLKRFFYLIEQQANKAKSEMVEKRDEMIYLRSEGNQE